MNYPPPVPGLLVAGVILCALSAALAWTFVVRYFRTRWWETPEGRHLMRFTLVLATTLTCTVAFAVFPIRPLFAAVLQVLLFGALSCELWLRNVLLGDAQREIHRTAKARRIHEHDA